MAIEVRLRDWAWAEIASVIDSALALIFALGEDTSRYRLLKYVDPYGRTIFNRSQMDDLLSDLAIRYESLQPSDDDGREVIRKVVELATICKETTDRFLDFEGD